MWFTDRRQLGIFVPALVGAATMLVGCAMTVTLSRVPATTQPAVPATKIAAVAQKPLFLPDNTIDGPRGTVTASAAPEPTRVNVFGEMTRAGGHGSAKFVADLKLRQITFPGSGGYDADVAAAPDGHWLVFSGSREGAADGSHLFRLNLVDGSPKPLTHGTGDDAQPCISPDGQQVAFCSNRSGAWHLYLVDAQGGEASPLTDGDGNEMHPSFSPDGQRLAFCRLSAGSEQQRWELCVLDIASSQVQVIGDGLFPSWSPRKDADVIAYQKARSRGSRWFSLWTCQLKADADTNQLRTSPPLELAASPDAALVTPNWSPDGAMLVFSSIATAKSSAASTRQDVWVIDAAGQNKRRLTDGTATNIAPCWAVSNTVYFVSDRTGQESIWSLPAPATSQRTRPTPAPMDTTSAAADPAEVKP